MLASKTRDEQKNKFESFKLKYKKEETLKQKLQRRQQELITNKINMVMQELNRRLINWDINKNSMHVSCDAFDPIIGGKSCEGFSIRGATEAYCYYNGNYVELDILDGILKKLNKECEFKYCIDKRGDHNKFEGMTFFLN